MARVIKSKSKKTFSECRRKKSCMYGKKFTGAVLYCDYLGMTGKMRPCPAENCTVYKRKKRTKLKQNS